MDQVSMRALQEYAPQVASAAGTVLSAKGDYSAASATNAAARSQAQQLRQNANQQMAAATVAAQEEQRKKDLIASKAIAIAAASGGGVTDPTVVRILQGIEAEGTLATQMQLYNGREAARGLNMQANAAEYEGSIAKRFYRSRALSTVLEGASKLANTWGSGTFRDSQEAKGGYPDAGSRGTSPTYA